MIKWFFTLLLIGVIGLVGYTALETYRKGYFDIPHMPGGAYAFSFKNGIRGIVLEAEVSDPIDQDMPKFLRRIWHANPDRRYLGIPFEVAPWFEDAWSICESPSEEERNRFYRSMPEDLKRNLENARFEAVCRIDVDGKKVLRGLLYSVPRL